MAGFGGADAGGKGRAPVARQACTDGEADTEGVETKEIRGGVYMVIPAEFHEREYENFFNRELEKLGGFVWTPGQLDENILGFDAGVWLPSRRLFYWSNPRKKSLDLYYYLKYFFAYEGRGVVLDREFLNDWEGFMNSFFPPRRLNFFAQYKRPLFVGRLRHSKIDRSGRYWGRPYYQFYIDRNQQRRLSLLEGKLGKSGVVTYSCAAFHTKAALWRFQNEKRIVRMSNFVGPGKLNGHSKYTFVEPGHYGFANPEPEKIEDIPLYVKFVRASEVSMAEIAEKEAESKSFSSLVSVASRSVISVYEEEDSNARESFYGLLNSFEKMSGGLYGVDLYRDIFTIVSFNFLNSTSWSIISPPPEM